MQRRRVGSARIPVTLSALAAIGIILGKFLAFNVTDFMRFSLENVTVIFAGIVFGPLLGAAIGAVQDLVGCLAVGYAINPIITLGAAAVGLVSGFIYKAARSLPLPVRIALSVFSAHALGSVLIKSVGLAVFYSLPFGVTVLWRILNYVIVGTAESVLLILLLKSKQLLAQINKIVSFSTTRKFSSASEASDFAKNTSGVFSKPGLERVTELLTALGNPEREVKVVHVAGTNGKGSTSAMLSSILRESGLKVGGFNSPYLFEMREAIRINSEPITEGELLSLFERLSPIAEAMADKPTEFELLTAAAYLAFKEARVDVAVIECGMGGEGDATNVIDSPLISIITGVAIDHTSYLGNSIGEIAEKKAGIIKSGCPVIVGKTDEEAMAVIRERAAELGAPIAVACDDYTIKKTTLDGTLLDCCGVKNVHVPLLGVHQPRNAALAIGVAQLIRKHFPTLTSDTISSGIAKTVWEGRFEILSRDPVFIFDGAHNLDGVISATDSIKTYFDSKVICLTGVLADKEYRAMAERIAEVASHAVTVTPDNSRALSAEEYAGVLTSLGAVAAAAPSVEDGVRMALELARANKSSVVCLGSLYLYKSIKEALNSILDN